MSQSCKFHAVGLSKLNDNASQCICRKVDRRWRAQNHWMIIFGVFLKENGWETTEVGTTPVRLPPIPGTSICGANSRVGDITSRPTPSLWGWCPGRIQWIFQWILCGEPRTYIYIYILYKKYMFAVIIYTWSTFSHIFQWNMGFKEYLRNKLTMRRAGKIYNPWVFSSFFMVFPWHMGVGEGISLMMTTRPQGSTWLVAQRIRHGLSWCIHGAINQNVVLNSLPCLRDKIHLGAIRLIGSKTWMGF